MPRKKPKPKPIPPTSEDLRLVNCACCKAVCLGDSAADWIDRVRKRDRDNYPPVCARLDGRPYCPGCYGEESERRRAEHRYRSGYGGTRRFRARDRTDDDASQFQENAIRDLEEGCQEL